MKEVSLIALQGAISLGESIQCALKKEQILSNLVVPIETRFGNGEGKVILKEDVHNKDVFILCDIGNYDCTYNLYGELNHMSPDDHYMNLKRTISAMRGNAKKIHVIMPLLYASRQHKRKENESLDCAMALQELRNLGVNRIITIDAHDPGVQNAIPCMSFENYYPTKIMLEELLQNHDFNLSELLVISPDTGAMDRARYYADLLKCDVGMFYKRRDLSKVVNGKNPIVAHEYLGKDVKEKSVLVVDDMIASGESMLEVAKELKTKGCKEVYLIATFGLFTKGIEVFDKAYQDGIFDRLYITNLTYMRKNIDLPWLHIVDCGDFLKNIIMELI